ncbi:MAG: MBL fold metallo-hydrolase [Oscillospiraceae bacterium]|jgi:glyoxylase-like metal-dependent hydrolase (beta-lactamase superfamily II)|nr:MBL fold metallo-hydrolase [Oscillospiraceae bacterium]
MPDFKPQPPVEVFDGVWNLTPGMSNSYLVVGSKEALLIDTGVGRDDFLEQIAKITDKPVSLVTTHAHGDHTGGHKFFGTFHIGEKDIPFLDDSLKANAEAIDPARKFDFGGGDFAEFIPLPGHTPGSYGVLIRSRRLLFTGDMICNGTIFMVEGQCDFNDFIASMDKISGFEGAVDYLVVCHGEPNALPVSHAAKQKAVAQAYLDGKLEAIVLPADGPRSGTVYANQDGLGFFRP